MGYALKNRNIQIPNGFKYVQPETSWEAPRFASFQTIVQGLKSHRLANPFLAQKHGWRTDDEGVAEDVEQYNVKVCLQMGWGQFLTGGDGSPLGKQTLPQPNLSGRVQSVVVGAEIIVDWLASGAEAVDTVVSSRRAAICAECPQNKSGDLLSFFTKPASEAIRRQLNRKREFKLETPSDDKLGVCQVCDCPMKLKVHLKIEAIRSKMKPEVAGALPPNCWIPKE